MTSPFHYQRRIAYLAATVVVAATIAASRPARAADLAEQAHSLGRVPADAAFYSASLRMKEQWDIFEKSNAYRKLMEIPALQILKGQAQFLWNQTTDPSISKVRDYLESSAGQDAVALVKEMVSDEV